MLGKIIAEPTDPDAFAQCCEERPDQCTDRYIGEFLQGTGIVYREDAKQTEAGVEGAHPGSGIGGSIAGGSGHRWKQVIEFPNPVYFAFKVTPTTHRRRASTCGRWVDAPPREEGHVHFVGSSSAVRSETSARERALRNAQEQAYASAMDPEVSMANDYGQDPAAIRWALGMQVVQSCIEMEGEGRGARYVGRVLGRLPSYSRGPSGPPAQEPSFDADPSF